MTKVNICGLAAAVALSLMTNVAVGQQAGGIEAICNALSSGSATLREGTLAREGLAPVRLISGAKGEVAEFSVVAVGLGKASKCELNVELQVRDVRGNLLDSRDGILSGSIRGLVLDRAFSPARDRPRETVSIASMVRQSETSSGCTCREVLGLRTVLAIYESATGKTVEVAPGDLLLGTSFSAPFTADE